MKTAILLVSILCFGCAFQPMKRYPYTKQDVLPIIALVAGTVADVTTTSSALGRNGIEYNPILGRHPDPEKVMWLGVSKVTIMLLIGRYVPEKMRRWIFGTAGAASGWAAVKNAD